MDKYRVIFRRSSPSPMRPLAERAFIDVETEQPSVALALAWAYAQVANTKDASLLAGITSVTVRKLRAGAEGSAND